VLDEPTTGLHMSDTGHLLAMLDRLVDAGNTVIVIEHNLDVIRNADWVIDLGPEGGSRGGQVLFTGAPSDLLDAPGSLTGEYLRRTQGAAAA
jgi:excinuclease UvrABC ATPase subunit